MERTDKQKKQAIMRIVENCCKDDPKKWRDYATLMKEFNIKFEAMIIRERHDDILLDEDFDDADIQDIVKSNTGGHYEW